MKYMMLIAGDGTIEAQGTPEERQAQYEQIASWWNRLAESGRIVAGHELQPSSTATTVRLGTDGSPTVTDGPFVEAKEMVGGYGILDVADLDEALSIASSWPVAPVTLEIRPVVTRKAS